MFSKEKKMQQRIRQLLQSSSSDSNDEDDDCENNRKRPQKRAALHLPTKNSKRQKKKRCVTKSSSSSSSDEEETAKNTAEKRQKLVLSFSNSDDEINHKEYKKSKKEEELPPLPPSLPPQKMKLRGGYWIPETCTTEQFHLAKTNPHPLDDCIAMEPNPVHRYWVYGIGSLFKSATTCLKNVYAFDAPKQARDMVFSEYWMRKPNHETYRDLLVDGKTGKKVPKLKLVQLILKRWKDNGDDASARGTKMHDWIDRTLNGEDVSRFDINLENSPELHHFHTYFDSMTARGYKPWRTEFMMFYEAWFACGTADMIWMTPEKEWAVPGIPEYFIADWKRVSKELPLPFTFGSRCAAPLGHRSNCDIDKYGMQISIYRFILMNRYHMKVTGGHVVVFNPNHKKPDTYDCVYAPNDVVALLKMELRAKIPTHVTRFVLDLLPPTLNRTIAQLVAEYTFWK